MSEAPMNDDQSVVIAIGHDSNGSISNGSIAIGYMAGPTAIGAPAKKVAITEDGRKWLESVIERAANEGQVRVMIEVDILEDRNARELQELGVGTHRPPEPYRPSKWPPILSMIAVIMCLFSAITVSAWFLWPMMALGVMATVQLNRLSRWEDL